MGEWPGVPRWMIDLVGGEVGRAAWPFSPCSCTDSAQFFHAAFLPAVSVPARSCAARSLSHTAFSAVSLSHCVLRGPHCVLRGPYHAARWTTHITTCHLLIWPFDSIMITRDPSIKPTSISLTPSQSPFSRRWHRLHVPSATRGAKASAG